MSFRVEDLVEDNAEQWTSLNVADSGGSFFHTLKWKRVIQESFGTKTHYFLVKNGMDAIALCPFCEIGIGRFQGLGLLPDSDYNNIVISRKYAKILAPLILAKCREILRMNRLSFVLVTAKDEMVSDSLQDLDSLSYPSGGNMVLDLSRLEPDAIWNSVFTKKGGQRKFIRRFEEEGFAIKEVQSRKELQTFYKHYADNLTYIGGAPYPFAHFEKLVDQYSSNELRIVLLHKEDTVAGGLLLFLHAPRKTVHLRYLALNRTLPNKYHAPYFLYWDAIKYANAIGYQRVSFGSTPCDPADENYRIKERFGCQYESLLSHMFPQSFVFGIGYRLYLIRRGIFGR